MKILQLLEAKSMSEGHRTNIETDTIENDNFRKVLFTTPRTQLVLMSLQPGEDIGEETHKGDQFFRFEKGKGKMVINGKESKLEDGSSVVVPEGALHNVINTGDEPLKLYALYSPPQHKDGTVDKTKPENDHELNEVIDMHKSKETRKLEKKTPKNKMYGGSGTFSAKEKENNRT